LTQTQANLHRRVAPSQLRELHDMLYANGGPAFGEAYLLRLGARFGRRHKIRASDTPECCVDRLRVLEVRHDPTVDPNSLIVRFARGMGCRRLSFAGKAQRGR
jgi:hypothetical protein